MERKRYALITGCGEGGIGQALTTEFINQGFNVIATVLPKESRGHLQHPQCHIHELDVTSESSVQTLLAFLEQLTGGFLDVLGNNAGIVYQMPAVDYEMSMIEKLIAVNVVGPMRMVRYLHPLLIKAKGIIFNTVSTAAYFPGVYQAAYCASKAALYQYGQTLRIELAPLGVRVINIISGEVSTNILKQDLGREIPKGSVYSSMSQHYDDYLHRNDVRMLPDEYARGVVKHVLSRNPSPRYWRGTWSGTVKILHRFFPSGIYDLIAYWMFHLGDLKLEAGAFGKVKGS